MNQPNGYLILTAVVTVFAISACSLNEGVKTSEHHATSEQTITQRNGNAPAQSGAIVTRSETALAITMMDEKTNLTISVAHPDIVPAFCGGGWPPVELLDAQFILPGNTGERLIVIGSGELPVRVIEGTPDVNDFDTWCPFWESEPTVIAEGVVSVHYNDNDAWGTHSNNQTNVWSYKVHGAVTTTDGETKNLNATLIMKWDSDEDYIILDLLQKVTVKLN
jgi:hypothetical protein